VPELWSLGHTTHETTRFHEHCSLLGAAATRDTMFSIVGTFARLVSERVTLAEGISGWSFSFDMLLIVDCFYHADHSDSLCHSAPTLDFIWL